MLNELRLTVNGEEQTLQVKPTQTLLWVLREGLGLTGTKEGCGEGECGACTVIMNDRSVNSCLVLALQTEGAHIRTVEGLAEDNQLLPIQDAFVRFGGLQCGFCTPGMLMQSAALLAERPHITEEELRHGLEGNLCRCTGYVKVVQAILAARSERDT